MKTVSRLAIVLAALVLGFSIGKAEDKIKEFGVTVYKMGEERATDKDAGASFDKLLAYLEKKIEGAKFPRRGIRNNADEAKKLMEDSKKPTALGIVSVSRERELTFTPFAGDPGIAFAPLPVLALPDGARLWRGTNDGAEECTPVGCAPLALPVCAGNVTCPVDEMESGDLDGDGRADVLLGRARDVGIATDGSALTRVFWWHGDDRPVTPITGIDPVDIEIADVDRDGNNDIIAQVREYISDFPSDTVVWRAAAGGWQRLQSFTNTDNHNDTMVVADIDGNGCVDWAYVGVDIPSVGVRLGDCQRFADVALRLTATTGVGVQFLDANGDGAGELVIRRERGGYHFLGWAAPLADGR